MIPKAPYCSEPCGDAAGKRLVVVWRSAEPTRSPGPRSDGLERNWRGSAKANHSRRRVDRLTRRCCRGDRRRGGRRPPRLRGHGGDDEVTQLLVGVCQQNDVAPAGARSRLRIAARGLLQAPEEDDVVAGGHTDGEGGARRCTVGDPIDRGGGCRCDQVDGGRRRGPQGGGWLCSRHRAATRGFVSCFRSAGG